MAEQTIEYFNAAAAVKPAASVKYDVKSIKALGFKPTALEKEVQITITNSDTFDAVKKLIDSGSQNVAVLNNGSHRKAGGGWKGTAQAQEECLFRRSNYFQTLTDNFYPLVDDEVVYSPEITVYADSEGEVLETVYTTAAIVGAAPRLMKGAKYTAKEYNTVQQLIDNIFKVLIANGKTNIVLGAIGCGVFNNPSNIVAKIFYDSVLRYGQYFENIVFAVLVTNDSDRQVFNNFVFTFKKIATVIDEDDDSSADDEESGAASSAVNGREFRGRRSEVFD